MQSWAHKNANTVSMNLCALDPQSFYRINNSVDSPWVRSSGFLSLSYDRLALRVKNTNAGNLTNRMNFLFVFGDVGVIITGRPR
jgi:hypothetical protein